jgi:Tfp pilus assembly protein PilX
MVMVIAILGLLTVAVNQAIVQVVRVSSRGSDSMTAMKQIENALHWMSIDVQQAQSIEPELGTGFPLSLSWTEWDGTRHAAVYTIVGGELKRSVAINNDPPTVMVIARYIDPAATNVRLTGHGTFQLSDANDTFTITGQPASSGHITINAGAIAATTTGTATYSSGAWSTPAPGDKVTIRATSSGTRGSWRADTTGVVLQLTQDANGNAVFKGSAVVLTLTAFGGEGSSYHETRQGLVFSRS